MTTTRYIETIPFYKEDFYARPRKRQCTRTKEDHFNAILRKITLYASPADFRDLKTGSRSEARELFAAYREDPIGIEADFREWMMIAK